MKAKNKLKLGVYKSMKYEMTENKCLMFHPEEDDFLRAVLCNVDTYKFFYPTGSAAFFGKEYVQDNPNSDFDYLIKMDNWYFLLRQPVFKKNYTEEIREFNRIMREHYDNFLRDTHYNDAGSVETWNVLINYQNKLYNIIICQTDIVFRKWKFATVCMINLCKSEKMKYILMNHKNNRVDLFKEFKEMFRLEFTEEEDIPF